ncbi:hypothetical protein KFL_000710350 [Klebsormidium nitens]|uniref:Uncharacterized protein n=1 Tax=Klebsormidium nitens TaxID=105231 RepID=A0A1Y1HR79_KLENI|nr:hypothetical protein KFL_000710350 [Klebsormidium nitens]|eukprot:GAQ81130.1 hypothetical protein KFL_000710350 [Klebsormidium nitens]
MAVKKPSSSGKRGKKEQGKGLVHPTTENEDNKDNAPPRAPPTSQAEGDTPVTPASGGPAQEPIIDSASAKKIVAQTVSNVCGVFQRLDREHARKDWALAPALNQKIQAMNKEIEGLHRQILRLLKLWSAETARVKELEAKLRISDGMLERITVYWRDRSDSYHLTKRGCALADVDDADVIHEGTREDAGRAEKGACQHCLHV